MFVQVREPQCLGQMLIIILKIKEVINMQQDIKGWYEFLDNASNA